MAKYDWKTLEKEYITSKYKTVSSFLKDKGIPDNGNTKKATKGWKGKKALVEEKKSAKTLEKIIEKQAEKEANDLYLVNYVSTNPDKEYTAYVSTVTPNYLVVKTEEEIENKQ